MKPVSKIEKPEHIFINLIDEYKKGSKIDINQYLTSKAITYDDIEHHLFCLSPSLE